MNSHYLFNQIKPISSATSDETKSKLLADAKKQVGFIPNMYSNMVNLPALLDTYLHGYGLFREQSGFTSSEQEVVFLAISKSNDCHYCMAAHSTLAANYSGVPKDILFAIRSGEAISDEKIAALYAMAVELNDSRGRPSKSIVDLFLQAGYNENHILAIILALSVKTISNYSNHLFDTEVDTTFAKYKVF